MYARFENDISAALSVNERADIYAREIIWLESVNAALLAALQECITADGAHAIMHSADTALLRRRIDAINRTAREAINRSRASAPAVAS